MATMVGTQKQVGDALNAMLQLEYDAVEAYKAAISRLHELRFKDQLSSFLTDHERHITELDAALREIAVQPAQKGDAKAVLAKGKVVIGGLLGDSAILMAMKTNEDDTNTAYERLVQRTDLPPRVINIVMKNLDDERRHRAWIEEQLKRPSSRDVTRTTSKPAERPR